MGIKSIYLLQDVSSSSVLDGTSWLCEAYRGIKVPSWGVELVRYSSTSFNFPQVPLVGWTWADTASVLRGGLLTSFSAPWRASDVFERM